MAYECHIKTEVQYMFIHLFFCCCLLTYMRVAEVRLPAVDYYSSRMARNICCKFLTFFFSYLYFLYPCYICQLLY